MPYDTCWVLTDGRRGMENQCLGLAEAVGLDVSVKRINPRAPWKYLPESLFGRPWPLPFLALGKTSDSLESPWPRLLIACGRKTVAYSIAIRRLSEGKTLTVQTQDPRIDAKHFDLVVPPLHDGLSGDNVMAILGSPNRINAESLAAGASQFSKSFADLPRPLVVVLIGGTSNNYQLTPEIIDQLAEQLKALAKAGVGLAITPSRRTGAENIARLQLALQGTGAYIWDGSGNDNAPNPYFGLLGLADHILVTEESTNMVTEAAATGKPVHIVKLEGGSAKFDTFHAQMAQRGITRTFTGQLDTWTYDPLNETQKVAQHIKQMLV